ncbi:MAG TPA: single-stranded DNA-binding protein [Ktedonobacterales bacterium]|nr:single-stranded DNA-binding protein [Ktedonobacterales bacterium]
MLNKIMLIGNLGRDPEMTYTPSGTPLTKFSLAVSRRWKDKSGERKDETTWFYVVAWDKLAELCNTYLHKGSKVYIEGRMTSRKYTNKDNVEVTAWDVVATDMQMLDPKDSQSGGGGGGQGQPEGDFGPDDIPF